MKIIYSIVIIIVLAACHPYEYMLNTTDEFYRLDGLILSELGSVEKTNENSIMLVHPAVTCLRNHTLTQYQADFALRVYKGEGIKISMRTVPHFFPNHPAISFYLTKNGYYVEEDGVKVFEDMDFRLENNYDYILKFRNQGDIVKFELGCDTLYYQPSKLITTEYLFFETLPGTKAKVFGLSFLETLPIDAELIEPY